MPAISPPFVFYFAFHFCVGILILIEDNVQFYHGERVWKRNENKASRRKEELGKINKVLKNRKTMIQSLNILGIEFALIPLVCFPFKTKFISPLDWLVEEKLSFFIHWTTIRNFIDQPIKKSDIIYIIVLQMYFVSIIMPQMFSIYG